MFCLFLLLPTFTILCVKKEVSGIAAADFSEGGYFLPVCSGNLVGCIVCVCEGSVFVLVELDAIFICIDSVCIFHDGYRTA